LSQNLFEMIKMNHHMGLNVEVVQQFTRQLVFSLLLFQQCQLVHSDLKPENIMIDNAWGSRIVPSSSSASAPASASVLIPTSTLTATSISTSTSTSVSAFSTSPYQCKISIIDFGTAFSLRELQNTQRVAERMYIQSRHYRSPEVMLGSREPFSYFVDIWSVGCVVAELLLGIPLFPGQNEMHVLHRITKLLGECPSHLIKDSKYGPRFYKNNDNDNNNNNNNNKNTEQSQSPNEKSESER
ncbi:protein serine/threonine kinase, partial [Reticulomyxa filosa]